MKRYIQKLYDDDPRDYALELIDVGNIDERTLIMALLKGTSHDYLRKILDANELSPRFL